MLFIIQFVSNLPLHNNPQGGLRSGNRHEKIGQILEKALCLQHFGCVICQACGRRVSFCRKERAK
jgi:hypothetical protein